MYRIVLILTLSVFSIEATNPSDAEEKIVDYKNENDGLGNYHFRFETLNGIARQETGRLVNVGEPDEHIAVEGFYSYKDSEGILQSVHYKADTNGYVILRPMVPAVRISETVIASLLGK